MTDRTALALKIVKPNQRKATLKKAQKLAGSKPVSPTHIRRAFGAYAEAAPVPPKDTQPPTPSAVPPVTDPDSAILCLESCYSSSKAWFNSIPPPTPRAIIDRLIAAIKSTARPWGQPPTGDSTWTGSIRVNKPDQESPTTGPQ